MELQGLNENNNSTSKQNKKNLKKLNLKGIITILALVGIGIGALVYSNASEKKAEEIKTEEEQEQAALDAILSDPHGSMDYYINSVRDPDMTNKAVAVAVAHVLSTGCTNAYDSLRKYFNRGSMEYLYDFVGGRSCGSYEMPPYVLQDDSAAYQDYKIRFNANRQYILHLLLDEDGYPETFSIRYFENGEDILEAKENAKEPPKKRNDDDSSKPKDHSDLTEATTTETTTEQPTETTTKQNNS